MSDPEPSAVPAWLPHAEALAVVSLIAAGQVALSLAVARWGAFGELALLRRAGALESHAVFAEPWLLVSTTWVHHDVGHLVGNLVFLLMNSVLLTRALGWDRFVLLYCGSGIAGSLAAWLLQWPDSLLGASGAVFGLTGATAAYAAWPRSVLHEAEVLALREAVLPLVGMQLVFSFMPGTAWGAHLGGFAFGAVVAATGVLDLGLPRRAEGLRPPEVRWGRVTGATLSTLALGWVAPHVTLALLLAWLVGLIVTGLTAPSWRPQLRVPVMLGAVAALAVNGAAVAAALWTGRPWELAPPLGPVEAVLPGGLGQVPLPAVLAAAREEVTVDGAVTTRFGDRNRFPFGLWITVLDRADVAAAGRQLVATPVDGEVRAYHGTALDLSCPLLAWETDATTGVTVVTGEAVVDLRLHRWQPPRSRDWREAEDDLLERLGDPRGCERANLSAADTVALLDAVGLPEDALAAWGVLTQERPDDAEPRLRRGAIFLQQARCDAAMLEFDEATRRFPGEAGAWRGAARARLDCSQSEDVAVTATELARRAATLAPQDLDVQVVLADALLASGRVDEAVEVLELALSLDPKPEQRQALERQLAGARRGVRVRRSMSD